MNYTEEFDCAFYSMSQAERATTRGEYKNAMIYLENANRSLNELQRIKNERESIDQAKKILERMEVYKQRGQME